MTNANAISVGQAGMTTTVNGALTVAQTLTGQGTLSLGDGGDAITMSGTTVGITANGAGNDISLNLVDDNVDALDIQQGAINYLNITTSNGAEMMTLGNSALAAASITFDRGATGNLIFTDYTSCTALETNGTGQLVCGTDDGGSLQSAYVGGNTLDITAAEGALDIDLQSANMDIEVGQGTDTGNFRIWDTAANWLYIDEGADTMAIGAAAGGGLTIDTGGGGIGIGTSNNARAINIGTGTAVDTINIGTGGTGADVITIGNVDAGALTIIGGTNSLINFPNFDVSTAGEITVAAGAGLDTNAAGTLDLGVTNANAITIGDTGVTTTNAGALTVTETFTANGTFDANGLITAGDGGDAITLSGTTLTFTANSAGNDITFNMVDNNPDAFDLQQGTDSYININTSDGAEVMTIGNSITNTSIVIDRGSSGTLTLSDYTGGGAGCTALETNGSGQVVCGTDDGGVPNFDEVYAESITDGNLTMEIDNATGLTYDLTTTGDFTIADNGTPFVTFNDNGTVTFDGVSTFNTDVNMTFADTENLLIASTMSDDVAAIPLNITLTDNAGSSGSTAYGLQVTNTDNGANVGVPDALARFANANAAETMVDGLLIEQSAAGTLTNALRILESAGAITNGLVLSGTFGVGIDVGSNTIENIGNSGTDFTNTGGLTLAGTLDANGQVDLGDGGDTVTINGTTVSISPTGAGNDLTMNLVDNNTDALLIQETAGGDDYLVINTTNTTESIVFGNTGTNPDYSFVGTGQVTFSGNVDATNGLDVTTANLTVGGSNFSVAPGTGNVDTQGTIQAGSSNITITTSAGYVDADAIQLITGDGTGSTSSGSGLETDTDRLGLLQGCDDLDVLKWDNTGAVWECADSGTDTVTPNVYTAGGTWNEPSGMRYAQVIVTAGGGGGGEAECGDTGCSAAGGGGGGGGTSIEVLTVAETGSSESVTVGAGGAGATSSDDGSPQDGSAGNSSAFGSHLSATAGGGGTGAATNGNESGNGGAGGLGATGDVNLYGGDGAPGSTGAEGPVGGFGGGTYWGGGAPGPDVSGSGSSVGFDANNYGGGGSGGVVEDVIANLDGGDGQDGLVVVFSYITSGGDVAEWYETKGDVKPGDVVAISSDFIEYESLAGGLQKTSILEKAKPGSSVVGVVSSMPFLVAGGDLLGASAQAKPIALAGRVPVVVSMENGEIKAGDHLTLSSTAGVAMRQTKAGVSVGKALEDSECKEGEECRVYDFGEYLLY